MINLLKRKFVKIVSIIILLIIVVGIIVNNSFVFANSVSDMTNSRIGILDGRLSFEPKYVLLSDNTIINEDGYTHGDKMISFAKEYCNNLDIYYYDITDKNNEITNDNIINGLNWMVKNNILKVNLSFSTKIYSYDL